MSTLTKLRRIEKRLVPLQRINHHCGIITYCSDHQAKADVDQMIEEMKESCRASSCQNQGIIICKPLGIGQCSLCYPGDQENL